MNFFKQQDLARKNTNKLLFLYYTTVTFTAIIIASGVQTYFNYTKSEYDPINNKPFIYTFLLVGITIFVVTFVKTMLLSRGGASIAASLGAIPVRSTPEDPAEKMYLNIVDEMAIASGIQRPKVYIIPSEKSINAFAAGHTIQNAAVCVTRGCLDHLTRDELQGVIAHEFGHIINGDMKLNIKLMGYLAGLSFLSEMGHLVTSNRHHRSSRNGGGAAAIGLIFFIVGGVGAFIAAWIKSHITKQREFHADANAVQFTRNLNGLGGALKKVYASPLGSLIQNPSASELSHMFIVEGFELHFDSHPPLIERIRAIYKSFNKKDFEANEVPKLLEQMYNKDKNKVKKEVEEDLNYENLIIGGAALIATSSKLNATRFVDQLSGTIRSVIDNPNEAHLMLYVLVAHCSETHILDNIQLSGVEKELCQKLALEINLLSRESQLVLLDLCLPTLKELPIEKKKHICLTIKDLALMDGSINHREWIFYCLVKESLLGKTKVFDNYASEGSSKKACFHLYSYIVSLEEKDSGKRRKLFHQSMHHAFGEKGTYIETPTLKNLNAALKLLKRSKPLVQEKVMKGATFAVNKNGNIDILEREILKLISETLNIPMTI